MNGEETGDDTHSRIGGNNTPDIKRPMVVLVSMEEVLELLHQYPQWFRYNGLRNATGFIQGMKGVSVSPSLYKELMEDNK